MRIGIGVGGTFTDIKIRDGDESATAKAPTTTPESDGVINAVEKAGERFGLDLEEVLSRADEFILGTTFCTNLMVELDGSDVGLVTTKGFRDIVAIRRCFKESLFDLKLEEPPILVPREFRTGVQERIDNKGDVVAPLSEDDVRSAAATFRENGIRSIAVCYLHSHVNPEHEEATKEIIEDEYSEANVYLSSSVLPQLREYERFSTTVVNAYVSPPFSEYLRNLSEQLAKHGFSGNTSIAQSSGGRMHLDYSEERGVDALFSGPSAGLEAAKLVGAASGYENLIAADMGGTSYDVSLITDGEISSTSEKWVNRNHVATPQVDINSIGAGGGSVAWIDEGGALRVGPESAGADPGPACYGRGGTEPTVTDADLVLGYLDPDNFLGGDMQLYPEKAKDAIATVAEPLDMNIVEASQGIYKLANNSMTNAIREISVERGHDPRDYVFVGYGGALGIHGPKQCDNMGVETCLIPEDASTLSALGCHNTNFKVTKVNSHLTNMEEYELETINDIFNSMREESLADMGEEMLDTFEAIKFHRSFDMQYPGQVHEVTVPLQARTRSLHEPDVKSAITRFHDKHDDIYAFKRPEVSPDLITLRTSLIGVKESEGLKSESLAEENASHALKGDREAHFEEKDGFVETDIYDGETLQPGNLVVGPGIIEKERTTVVVQPGQMCMMDANGTFDIKIQ